MPSGFDQQAALKKKLEAQAAERQKRKDLIAAVAEELWEALVDHTIRFNVSEWSAAAVERVCQESREAKAAKGNEAASSVLNALIDEVVKESVQETLELMRLRMRAFEAVSAKSDQSSAIAMIILNALEREICDEAVKEAFLELKAIHFVQRRFLKQMRAAVLARKVPIGAWKRLIHFEVDERLSDALLSTQSSSPTVHLLFVVDGSDAFALEASKSLLSPISASSPANELAYLQTFLPPQLKLQMISSYQEGPALLSRLLLEQPEVDFFSWPPNYPAPTHVFVLGDRIRLQNIEQIPWNVHIFTDFARFPHFPNGRFKHPDAVIESLFSALPFEALPAVEFDLLPSQLIPQQLFEMFIKAPDTFTIEHVVELFRICCAILWESSAGQKVLLWHPQSAGRSAMLETLSKAPQLPSYFGKLMTGDLEKALGALDEVIGPGLVACRELLFTNQSLSMIQSALSECKNKI